MSKESRLSHRGPQECQGIAGYRDLPLTGPKAFCACGTHILVRLPCSQGGGGQPQGIPRLVMYTLSFSVPRDSSGCLLLATTTMGTLGTGPPRSQILSTTMGWWETGKPGLTKSTAQLVDTQAEPAHSDGLLTVKTPPGLQT